MKQPVTSRPVSGERFLVSLNFREISIGERELIEQKLWEVCAEIEVWEEKRKKVVSDQNLNSKANEKGDIISDTIPSDTVDSVEKSDINSDTKTEKVEKVESDDNFVISWPFLISQENCERCTNYLSSINNSHIITQLISHYKIIKLATDNGCAIADENILMEIGKVQLPDCRDFTDLDAEKDRKRSSDYYSDDDTENSEEEQEYEYEIFNSNYSMAEKHCGTKKTNKRRIANNKKRRLNKKNKLLYSQMRRVEGNEECEDSAAFDENRRKVSFDVRQNEFISTNEICAENTEKKSSENQIQIHANDHIQPEATNTTQNVNGGKHENTSISVDINTKQITTKKMETINSICISDVALNDEKKKPVNVNEYYKTWRIYDLDVVY